jgi:uncharacterized protein involved in cysteine biosynthesis
LFDRAVLRVLLKVVLLSLALFALLGVGAFFGLSALFAFWGWDREGGLAAAAAAALIAVFSGVLLFRVVAVFIMSIFADEIVDAVERRHYPLAAEKARPPGYALGLRMGLASVGRALLYNLLAAPVYAVLLFTGIGVAIAFLFVNALLLGRDLSDMVAARHVDGMSALSTFTGMGRGQRFLLGLMASAAFLVPLVNLLAPVIGAAMATHLTHRSRAGVV